MLTELCKQLQVMSEMYFLVTSRFKDGEEDCVPTTKTVFGNVNKLAGKQGPLSETFKF